MTNDERQKVQELLIGRYALNRKEVDRDIFGI
jgi:hypothetical protein